MRSSSGRANTAEPRRRAAVGRLGWGVADQAVSSLGNFAFGILVVRALAPDDFGAFALALVTYGVVLNASRGLATDPLVVRFSHAEPEEWRRAVSAACGTALGVGVASGVVCVAVGLALPGQAGEALVALGCVLPGLTLQDSWRFAFFSRAVPVRALVNDLLWTILQVGAMIVLLATDRATVVTSLVAFGGTAAVAAVVGWAQCHVRPHPELMRWWLVTQRSLGGRYLVENVSISGARQLRMSALGALAGLAAVGEVRAAEMLMGPFMVVLMGISQVAVPEAVQVVRHSAARLKRFCLALGGVQAAAAVAWGAAMLVLVPRGLGELLLGDLWPAAFAILVPVLLNMTIGCFENGAMSGVRALGASRHSLSAQLTNAALYLVGGTVGAALDGARGSCWGVAAATAIATVVWWRKLARAVDEHMTREGSDARLAPVSTSHAARGPESRLAPAEEAP